MLKNKMEEEGLLSEADEKTLTLVKDILRTLIKTVKTFNVYPSDNPIYQKFGADLYEKFNTFFELNDELAVDVRQHTLLYKDKVVFQSEERTDNVALLLFADGIRQVSFQKGMTPEETVDFIEILRLAQKAETKDEDDIVTLLWEKNIKNMSYRAVEDTVDDNLFVEEALAWEEPAEVDAIEADKAGAGTSLFGTAAGFFAGEISQPLTTEERDLIKDEVLAFSEKFLLSSASDIFFEMLSYENAADAFKDIMLALGKIVDSWLRKKDIQGVIEILKALRSISADYTSAEQTDMGGGIFAGAGTIESLRMLFGAASSNEEIRQYLTLLSKNQIPNMIELLAELQERRQRRLLCEVLAEVGKEDIDAFSRAVDDPRWYLVRNAAMILGMTKMSEAVKYVEKTLKHPDLRVRREAIRALDGIPSSETKRLFVYGIKDPDLTVRITALKALGRYRDPELFQTLKGMASVEELRKKPLAEKKEILEAIAFSGGVNALPLIADLFKKRGFIEKKETTEIRASAAYGLGVIGTPEALSLLQRETESKKDILRDACLKALKESQQGGIDRR